MCCIDLWEVRGVACNTQGCGRVLRLSKTTHGSQWCCVWLFLKAGSLREPAWPARVGLAGSAWSLMEIVLLTAFHLGWRFWASPRVRISAEAIHASGGDALVPGSRAAAGS